MAQRNDQVESVSSTCTSVAQLLLHPSLIFCHETDVQLPTTGIHYLSLRLHSRASLGGHGAVALCRDTSDDGVQKPLRMDKEMPPATMKEADLLLMF